MADNSRLLVEHAVFLCKIRLFLVIGLIGVRKFGYLNFIPTLFQLLLQPRVINILRCSTLAVQYNDTFDIFEASERKIYLGTFASSYPIALRFFYLLRPVQFFE